MHQVYQQELCIHLFFVDTNFQGLRKMLYILEYLNLGFSYGMYIV